MADPITDAPKPLTRAKQWTKMAVPKNPAQAHSRIRASRRTRHKPTPKAHVGGSIRGSYVAAVEMMRDRYDVSIAKIIERFVADGIAKYGDEEELQVAQLTPSSPFDDFAPKVTQTTWPMRVAPNGPAVRTEWQVVNEIPEPPADFVDALTIQREPDPLPGLAAGPELPTNADAYASGPKQREEFDPEEDEE